MANHYIQGMTRTEAILNKYGGRFTIAKYDPSKLNADNINEGVGLYMTLKVDPPLQNLPVHEESDSGIAFDISDQELRIEAMCTNDISRILSKINNEH